MADPDPHRFSKRAIWKQSPSLKFKEKRLSRRKRPQSQFTSGVLGTKHQYKKSIIQKYKIDTEYSFLRDLMSSLSLCAELLIVEKREDGTFQKISVDEMFESDVLNPLTDPASVILQGCYGSCKSFIAQRFMLDWAFGKYFFFDLVFYLKCEELMCISEEMSLIELLSWSCSLTSDQISQMLQDEPNKLLFIIDGFDELRLTQDLFSKSTHIDPLQKATPEVIVCSLMRRYIIPESFMLVTSRTKDTVGKLLKGRQRFTEIMGFSERGVDMYFQNHLSMKAYSCLRSNKALYTACSIPVICWIFTERFKVHEGITSDLKTTTSIYVDFVSTLLEHHCQGLSESVPTLLKSLGQLAERGMLEQQVLFDEKSVNQTVSDPAGSPFQGKFLSKKTIHQETMFCFIHLSFQEFFTALYYVLLNEEESQKKVRELLYTVERGWALSYLSVADFSIADSEIRISKQLQPVILFLCGLCKNEMINSFFKKHNVALTLNIETQLKEWIRQCLLRYQHENMLFILHCLYELHEKSFIGKVLEGLILIDLSNISLNSTDCWVLQFCLQCCGHIRNLRLSVTSDNLKILQPALCSCKELWLMVDQISEDIGDFISALGEGKILMIKEDKHRNRGSPEIIGSVRDRDVTLSVSCFQHSRHRPLHLELTLTCPCPVIYSINWRKVLQIFMRCTEEPEGSVKEMVTLLQVLHSASGLKKVHLQVDTLTDTLVSTILSLIQACPSLSELGIKATLTFPQELIQTLQESLKHMNWLLNIRRMSVFLKRDINGSTEEELKTENLDETLVSATSSFQAAGQTRSTEEFTPEFVERDEVKGENTYRFMSSHAGQFQCSLTNLVFVMEGKGEMLYKIVPWDPCLLDGLGQMQPAGPLYNIDCFEGSISELHLPHCEILSEKNKDHLDVAHFTGDNVEMLQPLKVTDTHVIIGITELSRFGLLKKIIFPAFPVRSQVLLFVRPFTVKQREKILDVHLLQNSVPVSEVQSQHKESMFIKTTSACDLIPGREYSLCCQPEGFEVQPQGQVFECNFGPNYHPTFEVFLDVSNEEVRLWVLDRTNKTEVWTRRRIILIAPSPNTDTADLRITEFVDRHRDVLIERVTSGMAVADSLKSKGMINPESYRTVRAAETDNKKMRLLFDVFDSGGSAVKAEFYRLLKDKEPFLLRDLETGLL